MQTHFLKRWCIHCTGYADSEQVKGEQRLGVDPSFWTGRGTLLRGVPSVRLLHVPESSVGSCQNADSDSEVGGFGFRGLRFCIFTGLCCVSRSVVPNSLRPRGLQSTRFLCPWDFPGKDTGVGCHFLLQGIFPTQGSNPGLLHCREILYQLSYKV